MIVSLFQIVFTEFLNNSLVCVWLVFKKKKFRFINAYSFQFRNIQYFRFCVRLFKAASYTLQKRFMLYEITWSKTLQNSPFFNLVVFCCSSLGIPWTNCEAFYQIISSIINIKFLQSVAGNRCFVRNSSRLRNHFFLFHFSHFFSNFCSVTSISTTFERLLWVLYPLFHIFTR